MLDLYDKITTLLLSYSEVTSRVSKNTSYTTLSDQYAIRPGQLNEDDDYPGIVLAIPDVQYDEDLQGIARHAVVTLEVRCVGLTLADCWALRNAVAYDDGTPNASTGLHGATDGTGLLSCQLESDTETAIDFGDSSDRLLFVVESTYRIEFSEGLA